MLHLFLWRDLTCNESNLVLMLKASIVPPFLGTWTYYKDLFLQFRAHELIQKLNFGLLHLHILECLFVYALCPIMLDPKQQYYPPLTKPYSELIFHTLW